VEGEERAGGEIRKVLEGRERAEGLDPLRACAVECAGRARAVSAASLQAYASGVLSAQGQSVNILNTTNPNVAGATFYVGLRRQRQRDAVNGTTRSVVSVPGNVSCFPQAPQTGWWYNPAEGGRGFSIEARGNRLFMAAFHYDTAGRAIWNFAGRLDLPRRLALHVGLPRCVRGPDAHGRLSPADPRHRWADHARVLRRLARHDVLAGRIHGDRAPAFLPNGLTAPPQANLPESGWWWNPQESGRGFFLEWQAGSVDLAGYMYDQAGNPTWYITVIPTPNPLAISGNWWTFAGGQSMGGRVSTRHAHERQRGQRRNRVLQRDHRDPDPADGRRIPLVRQAF
jgi:hypothetical protein